MTCRNNYIISGYMLILPTVATSEASHSEYLDSAGEILPSYQSAFHALEGLGPEKLAELWRQGKRKAALDGVTFLLDPKVFRTIPTDWIPRIIPQSEWEAISAGVTQRLKALNLFLLDLYTGQQKVVPEDVIYSCQYYYPQYQDFRPARDVFVHICGIDLVHLEDGRYVILEDNLRIPSGISHQLKSLDMVKELMPELAAAHDVVPYDIKETYRDLFTSLCDVDDPMCLLLTDSKFGSAFFEHRYLSHLLGIPLVEDSDLYVGYNGRIMAKGLDGDFPVDLIYRRVEDLEIFVPGLTDAYLNGKVVLINGMGASAAADKLVFKWVPDMIPPLLGRRTDPGTGGKLRPAGHGEPEVRAGQPGKPGGKNQARLRGPGGLYHARSGRRVPHQPGPQHYRAAPNVHRPGNS